MHLISVGADEKGDEFLASFRLYGNDRLGVKVSEGCNACLITFIRDVHQGGQVNGMEARSRSNTGETAVQHYRIGRVPSPAWNIKKK